MNQPQRAQQESPLNGMALGNRSTAHKTRGSFLFIWGAPAVLGGLTLFGLLAALLGVGIWHWASWICLAIPLGVIARCWCKAGPQLHR